MTLFVTLKESRILLLARTPFLAEEPRGFRAEEPRRVVVLDLIKV